jgi:hypothetical protein
VGQFEFAAFYMVRVVLASEPLSHPREQSLSYKTPAEFEALSRHEESEIYPLMLGKRANCPLPQTLSARGWAVN